MAINERLLHSPGHHASWHRWLPPHQWAHLLLERLLLSSLFVQEQLQNEGAQQNGAADAQAERPSTQAEPFSEASEADPFGLDQMMQKEDASK